MMIQVLARGLKNAESQTRTETMVTFGKVCKGMGGAAFNVHKDIYKVSAVLRNVFHLHCVCLHESQHVGSQIPAVDEMGA
jgi:hypothetical protein